ncbi:MAG: hypothetical protein IT478_09405 [Xanthomonadales bacterium]|nr:hypothetical protein [Xanthomonadales bacterium]
MTEPPPDARTTQPATRADETSASAGAPLPFADAYPLLVAAAGRGDTAATIALAKGLKFCTKRPIAEAVWVRLKQEVEQLADDGPGKDPQWQARLDYAIGATDRARERLDRVDQQCLALPADALDRRWGYQLAAARTGDADSIYDLLDAPDIRDAFRKEDRMRIYREEAPRLLEQLIQQGDLRGYQAYVRAGYDELMKLDWRFHDALSRVLVPDPVRVLAYDIALARSGVEGPFGAGPNHEALRDRRLDAAQVIAAESLAQQLLPSVTDAVSRWRAAHPPAWASEGPG